MDLLSKFMQNYKINPISANNNVSFSFWYCPQSKSWNGPFNPSILQSFNSSFFPFSPQFRKLIFKQLSDGRWGNIPQRGANATEPPQTAFCEVAIFWKNRKNTKMACFAAEKAIKHAVLRCNSITFTTQSTPFHHVIRHLSRSKTASFTAQTENSPFSDCSILPIIMVGKE